MLTNTHVLIGAALLTRKKYSRLQNIGIVFGGFLPDLSVFLMVVFSRFPGFQNSNLWRQPDGMYWQEPWQFLSAFSNSIPLYAALALVFLLSWRKGEQSRELWLGLSLLFTASLLHVIADFPVHADDAHIHFWPFTDARFHSPISYWDSRHFGEIVGVLEAILGVWLAVILWRRFESLWPRIGVVVMVLPLFLSLGFSIFSILGLV